MEKRKSITEDDLLLTELMMARSYANLKKSVVKTSFDAIGSVGGTIRKHPYAVTAGAAVGAGILLFGLLSVLNRGSAGRMRDSGERERSSRPDLMMELFSMLMPVVAPYLTAYVEKYLGNTFSRSRNK